MPARAPTLRQLLANTAIRVGECPVSATVHRLSPRQSSQASQEPQWNRAALSGRLTELSGEGGAAALTAAVGLVVDAQAQAEPVAWITLPASIFYPPDVADSGVDLDALAIVRVPDARGAGRAADRLARSGAFGLLVLDLGKHARVSIAQQGRLVGLAQKHDTAIVCITEKSSDTPSLGSMVSLRAEVVRETEGDHFRCRVKVLKDKRRGPGWSHVEVVRGPDGLR